MRLSPVAHHFLGFFLALLLPASLVYGEANIAYNVSLNSQVRSAFAGPHGITISWNTFVQLDAPTVHFGTSEGSMDQTASSNVSVTYPSSLTYNNHVRILNLEANTQYWYLPDGLIDDTVGPFTFKTPRVIGDMTPYTVGLVVDLGAMGPEGLSDTAGTGIAKGAILLPGEQNTIQSITTHLDTFDFLIQPGDFAYADTWLTETTQGYLNASATEGAEAYESILNIFYDQLTNITKKVPFMTAPGNHEANCVDDVYDCPIGQSNFTGYINHFRMPSDVASQAVDNPGVGNMWYSYDNGMVHYVSLDMETDYPDYEDADYDPIQFGSYLLQQVDWLAADLAAVDRCKTPWLIVTGHRPWYASGNTCPACQDAFEALFVKYNVDLYFSGHYHLYERQRTIGLNGTIDPNHLNDPSSPWYIVNGAGGHYGGLSKFTHADYAPRVFGLSVANATYGWSRLVFHNRTHLTHEFVNSSSNAVLDSATLYKNHTFADLCESIPASSTVILSSSSSLSSTGISTTTTASGPGFTLTSPGMNTTIVPTITLSNSLSSHTSISSLYPASSGNFSGSGPGHSHTTYYSNSTTLPTASSSISLSSYSSDDYTHTTSSESQSTSVSGYSTGTGSSSPGYTLSTVYSTVVSTITSCAATVTDCPARTSPVLTTKVISLYTTWCPVAATEESTSRYTTETMPTGKTTSNSASENLQITTTSSQSQTESVQITTTSSPTTSETSLVTVPLSSTVVSSALEPKIPTVIPGIKSSNYVVPAPVTTSSNATYSYSSGSGGSSEYPAATSSVVLSSFGVMKKTPPPVLIVWITGVLLLVSGLTL